MTDNTKPTDDIQQNSPFDLLTDNQWRFVSAMIADPSRSKKDAADVVGVTADTVYRWGSHVDDALKQARRNLHYATLQRRKQALLRAMEVKLQLLDSEDESIRSRAATEIIEWELGKSTQRTEHTGADGEPIQVTWEQLFTRDDD